ncbi:MAG TPA: amidohydrolase family protein [Micromonosporaceae bacterium]
MLAIRAARLFDGVSAALVPRPMVLVEAGRIVAVRSGGEPPADARLVDLGDVTLLPGLVDAHVHLVFDASADPVGRLADADDEAAFAGMRRAAATALAAGITTVRDLGDRGYLGVRLRDEPATHQGPRVLAAGPPITVSRGHCWFLGGEADGVDGVRAAVREHAERGVDVIKVMATGGELTPTTRPDEVSYGAAELRAAASEAHRLGLPITAHAHAVAGVRSVVEAGFDMVEHGTFMTAGGTTAEADDAVIEAILGAGVIVSATMGSVPGSPVPPRIAAIVPQLVAVFERLRAAGVPVICGSDGGIGPNKPHDVLPYSAEMMVNLDGYATQEALRAVTSLAADACGVGGRVGRAAPGYDADLLAVAGDPLVDIAALRNVRAVFRAGERVR